MQCEECGKHEAVVHFTQMVDGEKTEKQICKECAAQKGFQTSLGTVDNIVSKMISSGPAKETDDEKVLVCRQCGTTYRQFRNTGRLGCSYCYRVFEENLKELLRKIHGSTKHIGKSPARKDTELQAHERVEQMREQLRKAVQAEQFEEAALLRDEIKRLEGELSENR